MAERNVHSMGIFGKKSLLCLFIITSILFMGSWFFVLHSAYRPNLVDLSFSPNSQLLAVAEQTLAENVEEGIGGAEKHRCSKILKVFMYDLPPQFHFGLLGWKPEGNSVWPDIRAKVPSYPGGLNVQHSVEYWLTLDLLASEVAGDLSGRSAVRVRNSSEADVVFVPFFSSICMNRFSRLKRLQKVDANVLLQEKLVKFLTAQEEWKRSMGKDHIILAHHPNSLLDARTKLWPAMFILSDFGRYPPSIANVEKDVIAPYKHIVGSYVNDTSEFDSRPILLFFQGAIYRKDVSYRYSFVLLLANESLVSLAANCFLFCCFHD
nr:probable arabinosyltransferase ARAD1 [Ipomoea batatas]GMD95713.1 probable arabinosyltransferase ARAD1 [Ipomoea batatas]